MILDLVPLSKLFQSCTAEHFVTVISKTLWMGFARTLSVGMVLL